MAEIGNALSRNPNVCASCSSLADGMDESDATGSGAPASGQRMTRETRAENEGWPVALVPMPQ